MAIYREANPLIEESHRRSVALFFYYALQDEKLATQATVKALQKMRKRFESREPANTEGPHFVEATMVSVTKKIWTQFKGGIRNTQSAVNLEGGWLIPDDIDLGPWREFRKESVEDEFLILLWSKVIKISDTGISKGLSVSVGTVRYRVGRALRNLGRMVLANG